MRFIIVVCVLVILAQSAWAEDKFAACPLQPIGEFAAGAVKDGRTLQIEDGRLVRLAGIEVPPGDDAKMALEKLVAGRQLTLKQLETATDRYGHLVAHVFVIRDGAEYWVEHEMIAGGRARVAAQVGHQACAAFLLADESEARRSKLGLWADPAYSIQRADDAAALLAQRGRFAIAEGKVLSVREAGSTLYLNFGRMGLQALSAAILKRRERAFAAAGLQLKQLEGRRVRIRGWIEERTGPQIEVVRTEQIEIVD